MKTAARLLAIALLTMGVSGAQQRPDAARVRQQLIGSYKLISYVSYDQNGAERKMPYVHGQISYDAAGRMSAQLMGDPALSGRGAAARGNEASDAARGGGAPQAERAGAGRGAPATNYVAYFGRYTIDADKGIVTHHVEGSLTPGMVGSDMPRWYELSADGATLFLMTKNGDRTTGRLRWDRYK